VREQTRDVVVWPEAGWRLLETTQLSQTMTQQHPNLWGMLSPRPPDHRLRDSICLLDTDFFSDKLIQIEQRVNK
jgi:hypothetical protein